MPLLPLFRRPQQLHGTAVAMVGARPGDAVLCIGAETAGLAAEISRVAGLNGRVTVVDSGAEHAHVVDKAAAAAGVLLEFLSAPGLVPGDFAGQFDIVVIQHALAATDGPGRRALVTGLARALRPGGRFVVILGEPRSGWWARQPAASQVASSEVLDLLRAAGAAAPRVLAEADGVTYLEARLPRPVPAPANAPG